MAVKASAARHKEFLEVRCKLSHCRQGRPGEREVREGRARGASTPPQLYIIYVWVRPARTELLSGRRGQTLVN